MTRPTLCGACTKGAPNLCFQAAYTTGRGPCRDRLTAYEQGENAERQRWVDACTRAGVINDVLAVIETERA